MSVRAGSSEIVGSAITTQPAVSKKNPERAKGLSDSIYKEMGEKDAWNEGIKLPKNRGVEDFVGTDNL